MPVTRMRMRPWLEQKIDSDTISGLNWVDKDKTMFSIPWKHAARHGWDLDTDACLFKEWAIHTGKYVEGQTSDPKTWKANFRCAMNSLPDIEEVKDRSINKGHQAVRVFRMLPSTPKSRDKRRKAKETKQRKKSSRAKMDVEKSETPVDESMSVDALSPQENTVDSTVNTEEQEFASVALSEVPDWSTSVDIGGGSTFLSNFCHRFEVSPEYSPDYECPDEIVQICQQLEKDSHLFSTGLDGKGFLCDEACTSPGSQWSESSSVDELEDMPQYTILGSDFTNPTDVLWNSFCQQIPPML